MQSGPNSLATLPSELLAEITSYLSLEEMIALMVIGKHYYHDIAHTPTLWQPLLNKLSQIDPTIPAERSTNGLPTNWEYLNVREAFQKQFSRIKEMDEFIKKPQNYHYFSFVEEVKEIDAAIQLIKDSYWNLPSHIEAFELRHILLSKLQDYFIARGADPSAFQVQQALKPRMFLYMNHEMDLLRDAIYKKQLSHFPSIVARFITLSSTPPRLEEIPKVIVQSLVDSARYTMDFCCNTLSFSNKRKAIEMEKKEPHKEEVQRMEDNNGDEEIKEPLKKRPRL